MAKTEIMERKMSQDQVDNVLKLVRGVYVEQKMTAAELVERVASGTDLRGATTVERATDTQTYDVATGAVGINLEDLEKLIYSELHPLVDDTPREAPQGAQPGTQAQWRAIKRLNTGRVFIGVPFGGRNEAFEVENQNFAAPYRTLGMETSVQDEADWMAKGFDNVRSLAALQLVQASKIYEEDIQLGGNASVLFGQPDAPTLADVPAEGNIGAGITVKVFVLPLTQVGASLQNDQVDQPVLGQVTRVGADGKTSVFGGFSGAISPIATVTVGGGGGHAVSATVPYITGVMSWAWYVGPTGAADAALYAITSINSILITEAVGTGVQFADDADIQADNSVSALVYDGRLALYNGAGLQVPAPAESGAYRKVMADGVAGEGTPLTYDGQGGIEEFNEAFEYFWRTMKLSPDYIYCAAGAAQDVSKLVMGSATSIYRLNADITAGSNMELATGPNISEVYNKILKKKVQIRIHPTIREGTYMFETLQLPVAAYPNSRLGKLHAIKLLSGYRQEEWPRVTREYHSGLYHAGVLVDYAPGAGGYITNAGRA